MPYIAPGDVMEVWKREFEVARDEGTMFLLTMHPQVIGHRARWAMLSDLIAFLREQSDVWFASHEQIARAVAPAA